MRKELYRLDPKPEDLVVSRLKNCSNTNLEDRIRVCCIKLERFAIRSEILVVSGDSWFSAKAI